MTSLYKWIYLQFLYVVIVVIFCLGTAPSCDKSEEKEEAKSEITQAEVRTNRENIKQHKKEHPDLAPFINEVSGSKTGKLNVDAIRTKRTRLYQDRPQTLKEFDAHIDKLELEINYLTLT